MFLQDKILVRNKILTGKRDYKHIKKELRLAPNNQIEIIINLGKSSMERKLLNSTSEINIKPGEGYIFSCRNTGMILQPESETNFTILHIDPLFTLSIFDGQIMDIKNSFLRIGNTDFRTLQIQTLENEIAKLPEGPRDPFLTKALNIIKEKKGEIKISELCYELNIKTTHLQNKFKQNIGLTPKEFARIEKINQLLDYIKKYIHSMTLTQLTFKSGYYDQSHLIKDFKYFLDMKPSEYVKNLT